MAHMRGEIRTTSRSAREPQDQPHRNQEWREEQAPYEFWRQLNNLPTVMSQVRSVTPLDDRRSHWIINTLIPCRVLPPWNGMRKSSMTSRTGGSVGEPCQEPWWSMPALCSSTPSMRVAAPG